MPFEHLDLGDFARCLEYVTGGNTQLDIPPRVKMVDHYLTCVNGMTSRLYRTNAGTIHEENQVPHLKIGNFQTCVDTCVPKYNAPCNRFCPAKVYEMLEGENGPRLQVNFTNCVHCQTCDIKCPEDNIRWTPPESGGGPRYEIL